MIIESLLDTDLYKFTMQQIVGQQFADAPVEYAFRCRNAAVDLRPFTREIADEVTLLGNLRFQPDEIEYLRSLPYITSSYADSLRTFQLDPAAVEITTDNKFELRIRGNWYQTILWEVPVLAIINEVYFRNTRPWSGEIEREGDTRLQAKCRLVREAALPDFALVEFGTRRRYGRTWQRHVLETLHEQLPQFLAGTSNVWAARHFRLQPFGTVAHEFLQACQAFAPLFQFQRFALDTWMLAFRGRLGIALSDVVGSDAFFRDFDPLLSRAYDGARHDSGDPYVWGEKLIAHYTALGLDPRAKVAVFSDGLDIPKSLDLARHFHNRIRTVFGVGTNLTNDLGFPALPIVIKMVRCNGQPVAKISDSAGKTVTDDPWYLDTLRRTFPLSDDAL